MGWFGDIWDSWKNTASNVWSGIKQGAGAIYDVVKKPVEWVSKGLEYASKIPGIGTLLSPVRGIVDTAKSVLDQGKTIGDVVKAVGLRDGGMVKKDPRYYQAPIRDQVAM